MINEKIKITLIISISLAAGIFTAFLFNSISMNYQVKNKKSFKRIVSLAPNITQTIYTLGAGNRVVGRSDFCKYPDRVKNVPTMGNNATVYFENLVKVKPDIIFIQGKNPKIKQFCKVNNVKLVTLNMDSIKTIKNGILKIGILLNKKNEANDLIKKIEKSISAVRRDKKGNGSKVLIIVNRRQDTLSGIFTVGKESFISELISLAGGKNIFKDSLISYTAVSIEKVINRNPDIIIEISINGKLSKRRKQLMKKQWSAYWMIKAVQNNKIYFIDEEYTLLPGPSIIKTLKLFKSIIAGNYKNK